MLTHMKEYRKLLETLHPLEYKILPLLGRQNTLSGLVDVSGLSQVEVMRALQWLENKEIIRLKVECVELVSLDNNGKEYLKNGLPEKRFLKSIRAKPLGMDDIRKTARLENQELNACIGMLKSKAAIIIDNNKISITENGSKFIDKESLEEKFLNKLSKNDLDISKITPEERFAYDIFIKRKRIIKTTLVKERKAELTELGKKLSKMKIDRTGVIDSLTPGMLKTGKWKGNRFRRYDVKINVPNIYGGKKHFVNQAIDYVKKVWLEMGFTEMEGNLLQTSFWNFDTLFTAQDHPVREMQDTFFISNPKIGKLPNPGLVNSVKDMHEHGGDIGSSGWRCEWDKGEALLNVLRTHTTVLSVQTIANLKESDYPAKFFAVGKCFRNEAVDWSHLFELTQTEGIVIDPDANLRNLLGYLKEFFKKMGFPKARFRPAFFPYTEPSVEVDVYHPVRKTWVELGGAGIFRPEVVVPLLGKDVPVLAWGLGLERLISENFNINDIRDLYKNDLKQIREMKAWMR